MAGDWIKIEKTTARKPEVLRIAEILQIHPDHAFGLCFRFWSWIDDHLQTANARGVSISLVDSLVDRNGFAEALIDVGWLRVREGSLEIPNMDRHLSQTAKTRAVTAKRVAKHTSKTNGKTNGASVSEALAREEKRREENNNTPPNPPKGKGVKKSSTDFRVAIPEALNTPEFVDAWQRWVKFKKEKRSALTETTAMAQIQQFADWGTVRAVAAINFTILKGYQGLLEPDPCKSQPDLFAGLRDFAKSHAKESA